MANSLTPMGQFTDEIEEAVEGVKENIKDAVGEMIEQNVKTTFGPQLTPQQTAQKQQDEQNKLVQARKTIRWYQDIELAQKKVREEEKQKRLQKQQIEEDERQRKKQQEQAKNSRIISPAKKTQVPGQPTPQIEELARTRQEVGKGHGVGG